MMITGRLKSTPTAGMELMIGLSPICTHVKSTAISSYNRLKQTNTWRPKEGEPLWKNSHTREISTLAKNFPDIKKPQDGLTNTKTANSTSRLTEERTSPNQDQSQQKNI